MSKGVQIAIAAFSIFVGVTWLIGSQADGEGTFRYYETVGDYLDQTAESGGGALGVRIHGFVVDGSIVRDLPAGHVDFRIRDAEQVVIAVRYLGIDVPDLFGDGAEVVVEGHGGETRFMAEKVMAKCPSKYEARAAGEDEA